MPILQFPFGQPIRPVAQVDRHRKRVFVLGVYASAVHAQWQDGTGRTLIQAVAVASEPCIFWTGEGAADIVAAIPMQQAAGILTPADSAMNGPSGRALDNLYLTPLGLTRTDTWLCDLLPESRLNPSQLHALQRAGYLEMAQRGMVPTVDLHAAATPSVFVGSQRPAEIIAEIAAAQPEILITLGEQPLKEFVGPQTGLGMRTLRSFGTDAQTYGQLHDITLAGHPMQLLPLTHPRQAAVLGSSSPMWTLLHQGWCSQMAPSLLR